LIDREYSSDSRPIHGKLGCMKFSPMGITKGSKE
jgi:hypothetical protein